MLRAAEKCPLQTSPLDGLRKVIDICYRKKKMQNCTERMFPIAQGVHGPIPSPQDL